jgi:hypothetical protein
MLLVEYYLKESRRQQRNLLGSLGRKQTSCCVHGNCSSPRLATHKHTYLYSYLNPRAALVARGIVLAAGVIVLAVIAVLQSIKHCQCRFDENHFLNVGTKRRKKNSRDDDPKDSALILVSTEFI